MLSTAAHAQPASVGGLPAAEVEAARVAARALPGAEALLARVEPHTGPGGGPALGFVGEFASKGARLKTRQKITCHHRSASWNCFGPGTEASVVFGGTEQRFPIAEGIEDRAVEIVDYLNSACFRPQPDPPMPRRVIALSTAQGKFNVRLQGDANMVLDYVLEESRDRGGCAFRQVGYQGHQVPQTRRINAEARERAETLMGAAFISGLAALIVPWLGLVFGRWTAAALAGVLAVATTLLFAIYDKDAISGNIRIDLLMIPVLAFVAWVECGGFAAWAYFRPSTGEPYSFGRAVRTIGVVLAGIVVTVVVAYFLMVSMPALLGVL